MLKKNYSKTGRICRVTFKYPNREKAESAALAGEFNDWQLDANPMKRLKDGSFSLTISLAAGRSYAFRYVLDGKTWVNDHAADAYQPNDQGSEDSIVTV